MTNTLQSLKDLTLVAVKINVCVCVCVVVFGHKMPK